MNKSTATKWGFAALGFVFVASGCSAPGGSGSDGSAGASDAAKDAAKALGVDLDDCPTDVTEPLGKTVKVGNSAALSGGPAAIFAPIVTGMKAGFEQRNAASGLDSSFELIVKDDQSLPDKARASAQELIDKDKIDLMHFTTGTPAVLSTRDVLGDQCIPMVPGNSGAAMANQPEEFPWAVMMAPSSTLEARIWVQDVLKRHPKGATVAIFSSNSDTGQDYVTSIKDAMKGTDLKLVTEETIEAADSAPPSSQVTTMKNGGAEVLFAAPIGAQCPTMLGEVANKGWKPDIYITAICNSKGLFDLSGAAGNGVRTTQHLKDPASARWADDAAVKQITASIQKYDPKAVINSLSFGGWSGPEAFFAATKTAADSDLGLSRLGILNAMRHLDYQPDVYIPGVKIKTDGLKDIYAIESAELQEYDSAKKDFKSLGLVDFEGQLTK